jgi:hypothetical protein
MADFTKTISEDVQVMGPSYTNKWGEFLWGQKWGDQQDPAFIIGKNLLESITSTETLSKYITRTLADSVSSSDDTIDIFLRDGAGYFYEFIDIVTDADDRSENTWTDDTSNTTSWSKSSTTSVSWGETT